MVLYIPRSGPVSNPSIQDHSALRHARSEMPPESPVKHGQWTPQKLDRFFDRMKHGKYGYVRPQTAAALEEVLQEGAGANNRYSKGEMAEVVKEIQNEHVGLGLNQRQAEELTERFSAGPEQ